MTRLLMLVSSAREIVLADGAGHPTGFFAEEALIPYERFLAAGVEVTVATPDGLPPHPDTYGLEEIFHFPDADEDFLAAITRTFAPDPDDIRLTLRHLTELGMIAARRIFEALRAAGLSPEDSRSRISAAARESWRTDRQFIEVLAEQDTLPLNAAQLVSALEVVLAESRAAADEVAATVAAIPGFARPANLAEMGEEDLAAFDAVFVPGGHGPMVDLADNPDVTRMIAALHARRATIASLCHGPAFLLSAPADSEGRWLFDGYRLTSFSDEEEDQTRPGLLGMPWYLETALKNAGAVFDDSPAAWTSHVVVDRNLVTGQNPMSAQATADAVLKTLDLL